MSTQSSAASAAFPAQPSLRVSQRPPTACKECAIKRVRCDRKNPCSRCARLSRPCTREVVRISKSLSQHRDEIQFLRSLRARLVENGVHSAVNDIDARIRLLEHGKEVAAGDPATDSRESTSEDAGGPETSATSAAGTPQASSDASRPSTAQPEHQQARATAVLPAATAAGSPNKPSILTAFEFLAWGRHSQACYPHRRCRCYQYRRHSELVSINSDPTWTGRQMDPSTASPGPHLSSIYADALLPVDIARRVIQFHMDYLLWHHNAVHRPTFLDRCNQFWLTGRPDHPLWLALYFSICSVSLWTLLNNEPYRKAVLGRPIAGSQRTSSQSGQFPASFGGFVPPNDFIPSAADMGPAAEDFYEFDFDEALVERQFEAMVQVLYRENFMENLSLYSVQAIVISTRIAHNLDRTDLNAILVGAAVRIAHCLGLHKILDPPEDRRGESGSASAGAFDWHERVEIETGKRVWLQLLIQDHFQIPYTDTYIINPSQYVTALPKNCNDDTMVEQPTRMPTNSSYVRMLGRTASLIPSLLDGLGPMGARKSPADVYQHIVACDRAMRANVGKIPDFLLREDVDFVNETAGDCAAPAERAPPWLPLARRTLAISAAEKIIMIHRPVLLESFQNASGGASKSLTAAAPSFQLTRTTCVAAATTILREHEQATIAQSLSIWTHSAFCVTAAVVLGLELLFHRTTDHTDSVAHNQRRMMARAADRLRLRRCDAIAKRGALLIDTLLAAEEDLVLRMMRSARNPRKRPDRSHADGPVAEDSIEDHQREILNEMIGNHEIMARFLAVAPPKTNATSPDSATYSIGSVSPSISRRAVPVVPFAVNAGTATAGTTATATAAAAPAAATAETAENMGILASMDLDLDLETGQDFDAWFNDVFNPVYDQYLYS